MRSFPIYLNLESKRVVVSGAGQTVVSKLLLLMKTHARIVVFGINPHVKIREFAAQGWISYFERRVEAMDVQGATLLYCGSDDANENTRAAEIGRRFHVLVNVVDDLEQSEFITPAIVDRDPVVVAIGTEGAAPILARQIKRDLEERLPHSVGRLARIGKTLRAQANRLPAGKPRRKLWSEFYCDVGPKALTHGGETRVRERFQNLLDSHQNNCAQSGKVSIVGAGPGDPELMTLKARNRLHDADVVVHDRLVPQGILELARREAIIICAGKTGYGPSAKQEDINRLLIEHASSGLHVVRLKSGDPTIFGRLDEELDALEAAGVESEIVPGITAATAAVATMGVSMTRRNRNSEVRLVTGHDTRGFTEQDWAGLVKSKTVTAIYMAKRAARFLQGRLLMQGASGLTPVTIVENASLPEQKTVSTTLIELSDVLEEHNFCGPVLILLGLAARSPSHSIESKDSLKQTAV